MEHSQSKACRGLMEWDFAPFKMFLMTLTSQGQFKSLSWPNAKQNVFSINWMFFIWNFFWRKLSNFMSLWNVTLASLYIYILRVDKFSGKYAYFGKRIPLQCKWVKAEFRFLKGTALNNSTQIHSNLLSFTKRAILKTYTFVH